MTDPDDLKPAGDPERPKFKAKPDKKSPEKKSPDKKDPESSGPETAGAAPRKPEKTPSERPPESPPPSSATISPPSGPAKTARPNWALRLLLLLLFFLAGGALTLFFLPQIGDRLPAVGRWLALPADPAAAPERKAALTEITRRLDRHDEALAALEERARDFNLRLTALQQDRTESDAEHLSDIPTQAADIAALAARLTDLEAALDDPQDRETDLSQTARIDMLLSRMSQLEAAFVPLSQGLTAAREAMVERQTLRRETDAQADRLAALAARLEMLEGLAARDASGARLAFRLGHLKDRLRAGQGYAEDLAALRGMLSGGRLATAPAFQDALATLAPHADGGLAPPDRLRREVDALMPALIRDGRRTPDGTWAQRLWDRLAGLIVLRDRTPPPGSLDDGLRQLEQALAVPDLRRALEVIDSLPPGTRARLADWIRQARDWRRAEAALSRLEELSVATLFPSQKPAAGQKTPLESAEETGKDAEKDAEKDAGEGDAP